MLRRMEPTGRDWADESVGITNRVLLGAVTSPSADFVTFDRLTDQGLIRQEYKRELPLPRLGEGRGEAKKARFI
jgi:hypothetical protein